MCLSYSIYVCVRVMYTSQGTWDSLCQPTLGVRKILSNQLWSNYRPPPFVWPEILGRLENYPTKMWAPIQWSRPKMPRVYNLLIMIPLNIALWGNCHVQTQESSTISSWQLLPHVQVPITFPFFPHEISPSWPMGIFPMAPGVQTNQPRDARLGGRTAHGPGESLPCEAKVIS